MASVIENIISKLRESVSDNTRKIFSFREESNKNDGSLKNIIGDAYKAIRQNSRNLSDLTGDISELRTNDQITNNKIDSTNRKIKDLDKNNKSLSNNFEKLSRSFSSLTTSINKRLAIMDSNLRDIISSQKRLNYITQTQPQTFKIPGIIGRQEDRDRRPSLIQQIGGTILGGGILGGTAFLGGGSTASPSKDVGVTPSRRPEPTTGGEGSGVSPPPSDVSAPSPQPEQPRSQPSPREKDISISEFTGELRPNRKGKVDPKEYYRAALNKLKNSSLIGFVPRDGKRFGITKGTAEEWARFMTQLTKQESNFSIYARGPRGEQSFGLSQMKPGEYGLRTMKDVLNPDKAQQAMIKQFEKYILKFGAITGRGRGKGTYSGWGGAAAYFGPLRRTKEFFQHNKWMANLEKQLLKDYGQTRQEGPGQKPPTEPPPVNIPNGTPQGTGQPQTGMPSAPTKGIQPQPQTGQRPLPGTQSDELGNYRVEYRTRREQREEGGRFGRTPENRTVFLDFNAAGKGAKGWEIIVPDNITKEELEKVKQHRDAFVKLAGEFGYKNYRIRPGGKYGAGILTTSENRRRRGGRSGGVPGTYHTEPGFTNDPGFRKLMGNPDFVKAYSALLGRTLGKIPGITFQTPHGDPSAPTGAGMRLPDGTYVTERTLAPRILKHLENLREIDRKRRGSLGAGDVTPPIPERPSGIEISPPTPEAKYQAELEERVETKASEISAKPRPTVSTTDILSVMPPEPPKTKPSEPTTPPPGAKGERITPEQTPVPPPKTPDLTERLYGTPNTQTPETSKTKKDNPAEGSLKFSQITEYR